MEWLGFSTSYYYLNSNNIILGEVEMQAGFFRSLSFQSRIFILRTFFSIEDSHLKDFFLGMVPRQNVHSEKIILDKVLWTFSR